MSSREQSDDAAEAPVHLMITSLSSILGLAPEGVRMQTSFFATQERKEGEAIKV